jgi:hypothetical protein
VTREVALGISIILFLRRFGVQSDGVHSGLDPSIHARAVGVEFESILNSGGCGNRFDHGKHLQGNA